MGPRILVVGWLLAGAAAALAVEVNSASQADLEQLRGIGPALSAQILEQRDRRPFVDWNDLEIRVRGLGPAAARRLSAAGLRVGGEAYPPLAGAGAAASGPRRSD